jgi:hypothetical protein
MATTKKATSTQKTIDNFHIISLYMDFVLSHNEEPKNVYLFCKQNQITESDFYSFYGSIEAVKQDVWTQFFVNAKDALMKDDNYDTYANRNKLLSLYFTLFEVMTLNRSYVVFAYENKKDGMKSLHQFKGFKTHFKSFVNEILETSTSSDDVKIQKFLRPALVQGAWAQFLFILKFWIEDTSKGFEKTDVMIEKSVKATFDVLDTTPLESLLDLGKFIWKEKFN